MSDELSLVDIFLTWMITYGAPAFGLALLLGALGAPFPTTFFVLAAGAFVREGIIDGATAASLGLLGAVLGDIGGYAVGRFAIKRVSPRFKQTSAWHTAQATLLRRGGITIYATRIVLTPLAVPVNLIAGGSGYRFHRFFALVVAGEFTWIAVYGSLGYVVGSQWELVSQVISDFSLVLVGVVVLAIALYILIRRRRYRRQVFRQAHPDL